MTRLSKALARHSPTPSSREANTSSAPRRSGRSMVTGPVVVLMVVEQCPLKLPGRDRSPWAHSRPRNSLTFGLERGLHQQSHPEPGYLLQVPLRAPRSR
jgi:hypothetical protein